MATRQQHTEPPSWAQASSASVPEMRHYPSGQGYSHGHDRLSHTADHRQSTPVYLDDMVLKKVRTNQSKFIQDRITQVEQHFGNFCQSFGAYSRKLGRLRDKGDDISKAVADYAGRETLNKTTQFALNEFSAHFAAVQDYRETEIKRIDGKVLEPFTLYGQNCKHAKESLKKAFRTRDTEMKKKKNLDSTRDKAPSDRAQISMAETELQKASVDASWQSKALEEEMDSFERKKLQDIKKILFDFVNIELLFHAKALEMHTKMYHSLNQISEEDDLEAFRNSLRPPSTVTRFDMAQAASGSRTSLNSTAAMNTTAYSGVSGVSRQTATPTATPTTDRRGNDQNNMNTLASTNPSSMYSTTTADDDDEDDDDEEEDDDDDDDDEEDSEVNDSYMQHFQARPAGASGGAPPKRGDRARP